MKKIAALVLAILFSVTAFSCSGLISGGKATALNKVIYDEKGSQQYFYDADYFAKLSAFSGRIYEDCAENDSANYVMSPLSLYMALAVLHSIGDDGVKSDIETLFGMDAGDISKTGDLFISLVRERKNGRKLVSKLDLTNSIWLDTEFTTNQTALDRLAEDFYCYAYKTPFKSDNKAANLAIRKFIKDKTKGLIDKDFDLDAKTLFAIINTLYFKDCWNFDKGLTVKKREFTVNGETKEKDFLIGEYYDGKVGETEVSEYFYSKTSSGYRIKFILPKEGVALKDAMTAENVNAVNYTKYIDEEDGVRYLTRCIFPKFKIESDTPVKEIFEDKGYLTNAFRAYTSDLTDIELCVSDIKHSAVLTVDEKGIEGAAVTIIAGKGTAAPPEHEQKLDFVIDRSFGFLVTDPYGVILFAGRVTEP
ncbi:MAG: hypothetical protein IK147_01855 [Clostridia bacterium]|nr:hypothetical protein [Clostridia bacterium]